MTKLVRIETEKTPKESIEGIKKKASDFNIIIRNVFDMAHEFRHHGIKVDGVFEYYSIMLCNPEKDYNGILKSPIRGALLFPPKQVVIYKENNKTVLGYVAVESKDVMKLLPEDAKFQEAYLNHAKI